MPRYFLHINENGALSEDPEGMELIDVGSARVHALAGGREILAERLMAGEPLEGLNIVICDANGEAVDRVGFSDLVRLRP